MPVDLEARLKAKSDRFKITGVDRGWVKSNALNVKYDAARPDTNCRYEWHLFENGDYCTIASDYREIWNSARTSAYMYGYRTGKRFKSSMGSHELLIWRQDDPNNPPPPEPGMPELAMLKGAHAYVDTRADVRLSATHELLQSAPNESKAHRLLMMYLLSLANEPQNYKLWEPS